MSGWFVIAQNYAVAAFFPSLLRQNETVFFVSLGSYFCANPLIAWCTLLFLKASVKAVHLIAIATAWLILFVLFARQNFPALFMLHYTFLSVFALLFFLGIVIIRSVQHFGKPILVLCLLNIACVTNSLFSLYVFQIPNAAPCLISEIILLFNAIGLSNSILKNKTWRYETDLFYRIFQASGELAHLADIILYHHEWWNNDGYPHGLKEQEIPSMSRIISILDAFDAMTHRRQDHPPLITEEALQELHRNAVGIN